MPKNKPTFRVLHTFRGRAGSSIALSESPDGQLWIETWSGDGRYARASLTDASLAKLTAALAARPSHGKRGSR